MSSIAQSSGSPKNQVVRPTDLMNYESRTDQPLNVKMHSLEGRLPFAWHNGPDKTPAEIQNKANKKYDGDTSQVEDKYRGYAIARREDFDLVLKGIVDELAKNGAPVDIEDKRNGSSLSGYPCINIYQNGCEIQLVTPESHAMYDVTHDIYKWLSEVKNKFANAAMPPHVEKDFHEKRQRAWLLNQATIQTPAFA